MSNTNAKSDLTTPSASASFSADSSNPSSQTNLEKDGTTDQPIKTKDASNEPKGTGSPQDTEKKRSASSADDSNPRVIQQSESERPSKLMESDTSVDVGAGKKPPPVDTNDTDISGNNASTPTVSPTSVCASDHLSAKSSLIDMPPEVLCLVLRYARPIHPHHQFEWSGLVSRTCRVFRTLTSQIDGGNSPIDLDLNQFEKYVSVLHSNCSIPAPPRLLLLKFLESLLNFQHQRARSKTFHYNFVILDIINEELTEAEKKSLGCDLRCMFNALFKKPASFPNLSYLDINSTEECNSNFYFVDWNFLRSLPMALPKLEQLCLGCCFKYYDARNEVTKENLIEFANSLQTPLKAFSVSYVPWLSDDRLSAFLKAAGRHLEVLELIHCSMDDEYFEAPPLPLKHVSLQSVAQHCTKLKVLRILDFANENVTSEDAKACDRALNEAVRANPNLKYVNNADFLFERWPVRSKRLTYTKIKELDDHERQVHRASPENRHYEAIEGFKIEFGSLYQWFDKEQELEDFD